MRQVWWKDVFRGLFGMLDGVVYSFIDTAYKLLTEIADFRVFKDETLQQFATRIYAILGIVMLFKLSFSFINYMINPEAFTDKQKGVQNIVKNIIIMFVMLILSPWVFTKLWDIQGVILDEQILSRFVFGSVGMSETNIKYVEECDNDHRLDNSEDNAGKFISIMVLRGFYRPYVFEDVFSDEGLIKELKGEDEYGDTITSLCRASTVGADSMLTSDIYNAYVTSGKGFMNFKKNRDYYVMEYHFGISTVVGVIVLLLLVNFCIDTGTRMVKLSFLQLIAPIPIVSYIDPASGKNGIFMKWIKEVGKTWIGLFIRLLAIFFAISIIQHVDELQSVGMENGEASIWVQIFVIIGALIFAKQLPDLIQNITGIKMEGGFNLNPFKKIENEALGGKFIANTSRGAIMAGANAAVSGVGQLASNGYNFFKTQSNLKKAIAKETDEGKKAKLERQLKQMHAGRFMVTSLGGAFRGSTRGLKSGFTSGRKGDYHVFKNAKEDIAQGNKKRDNLANIHKYNSEVSYRAKQDKEKFKSEYEAIKARTDLTDEEKESLLKNKKQEYQKQKAEHREQHYGFVERNIGERLDQWAGVKNEYGGVGYYDKKISDLERKISNSEGDEASARQALSNYCANKNINQRAVEKVHKAAKEKSKAKIQEAFEKQYESACVQARYEAARERVKKDIKKSEYEKEFVENFENFYNEEYERLENDEFNKRYQDKVDEVRQTRPYISDEDFDKLKTKFEKEIKQSLKKEAKENARNKIDDIADAKAEELISDEEVERIKENISEREIKQKISEEDIRKSINENDVYQEALNESIGSISQEYGMSAETLTSDYNLVRVNLENIDEIDEEIKEMKVQKTEFKDLMETRGNAEKK